MEGAGATWTEEKKKVNIKRNTDTYLYNYTHMQTYLNTTFSVLKPYIIYQVLVAQQRPLAGFFSFRCINTALVFLQSINEHHAV